MKDFDIVKAKEEVRALLNQPDPGLAIAKYIGEPFDPDKPVDTQVIAQIFELDEVGAGEDVYVWEDVPVTKSVTELVSNGAVTTTEVTPATPTQLAFSDLATDEFYITVSNILKGKYDVLAKKRVDIEEALNRYEIKKAIDLIDSASGSNLVQPGSGDNNKFRYPHLVQMMNMINNYGDKFLFVCGKNVNTDIILWNFNEDKNQPIPKLEDLGIKKIVLSGQVKIGATTYDIIDPNVAYLIATAGSNGKKPGVFVRRNLKALDGKDQVRVVLPSAPLQAIGSNRILSYSVIGYEQIAMAIANDKVVAKFAKA